jgi:putative hydrolase
MRLSLDEDFHVHSRFSDGVDSPTDNVLAATAVGLRRLGCVDHVRRDTTYVPEFVAAIRELRDRTAIELTIGIEAKILDVSGALDLPANFDGVDLIYVADHQVPTAAGPVSPRVIREHVESTAGSATSVVEEIVAATVAAMRRGSGTRARLVLAHLFSVLPKIGVDEGDVPDGSIRRIVDTAAETGTIIEVSERWRCPGPRLVRAAMASGVRIVASTDSHKSKDIGRYEYVAQLIASLDLALTDGHAA